MIIEHYLILWTNHIKAPKYKPLPFHVAQVTLPECAQDVPPHVDTSKAQTPHLSLFRTVKKLLEQKPNRIQSK